MARYSKICFFSIKLCMYIMSAMNICMAISLLLLSIMQKGTNLHALADYFCFTVFLIIAFLAALSSATENFKLRWPLFGATIAILVLLLIALIYHLIFCYRHRVDIFEVAGSATIYLIMMAIAGFCIFVAIRWQTFITRKINIKKKRDESKETKSLINIKINETKAK
uniref:MARVEL domain-containing protein n=1 Tax=Onchocerca volvulus TaxID=6282 RepID=A0A2K6WL31_ONCVO